MSGHANRPRDPNQLAKSIVDVATGERSDHTKTSANPILSEAGKKGGRSRANKLSSERREEIAREAARRRWGRGDGNQSSED
ncbi:histone H1 [Mesorhizobium loti]|nr:histone H1 [Mesorhizobium loti]